MQNILVITGPSGVGKSTLIDYLEKKPLFKPSVSYTTRPKRPNETDGVHYHFVTKEEFEEKIAKEEFLEYKEYCGNYYGTPKYTPDDQCILIMDVEQDGLVFFKEMFPRSFFCLVTANREILEKRLMNRLVSDGEFTNDQFLDRMEKYDSFNKLKNDFTFNAIIDNSKSLDNAFAEVEDLVDKVIKYYNLVKNY